MSCLPTSEDTCLPARTAIPGGKGLRCGKGRSRLNGSERHAMGRDGRETGSRPAARRAHEKKQRPVDGASIIRTP